MIIQLVWDLLLEKKIIIISSQPLLLYQICQALIQLIFLFEWVHTLIPVLPSHFLHLLKSPFPFLIGVLYDYVSYSLLQKQNKLDWIIVDVDRCQMNTRENVLDDNLLFSLVRKIQLVKNPEIFQTDKIVDKKNKKVLIEDIDQNTSFGLNIQAIFFRPLRNILKKYMGYRTIKMNDDKPGREDIIFDKEKFLSENLCSDGDEKYKETWEEIVNNNLFSFFIGGELKPRKYNLIEIKSQILETHSC